MPGEAATNGAASCAAASCTETSPFANPGSAPIAGPVGALAAHPQGRSEFPSRGDRLPVARPVALEGGEQPLRMRERRLARAVHSGEQRRALALEPAEQRIHEAG